MAVLMSGASRPSKRLSAQAKVQRDRQIVSDRARGLRWETIANRHDLTTRQCQSIWRSSQAEAVEVEEPLRSVDDVLGQIEAAIEEAAVLSESTANDSIRLGAINTRLKALTQKVAFMQACGLLPRDLGLVRNEIAMSEGINRVVDFLRRFNLSAEGLPGTARADVRNKHLARPRAVGG
jgi:hypothetical protein